MHFIFICYEFKGMVPNEQSFYKLLLWEYGLANGSEVELFLN